MLKKAALKLWPWMAVTVILLLLAPLASSSPDGLERSLEMLGIAPAGGSAVAPLADYQVPGVASEGLSTVLAGLIGAVLVLAVFTLGGLWWRRREE